MIKALWTREGRSGLGIGLSRENVDRLIAGLPIHFSAESMGMKHLDVRDVVVFFGETEDSIQEEFKRAGVITNETMIIDDRVNEKTQ